jgi:hypothetical protein
LRTPPSQDGESMNDRNIAAGTDQPLLAGLLPLMACPD